VVVVLTPEERPSPELVAALAGLAGASGAGTRTAPTVLGFLGRDLDAGATPVAWIGPPGAGPVLPLAGRLHREGRDVTGTIAWLDACAARAAELGAGSTVGDLTWRPAVALVRRLLRRRRDGVPGLIIAILETYGEVLIAAKAWERRPVADPPGTPDGFTVVDMPSVRVLVRRDVEGLAALVLEAIPEGTPGERLDGGRGGVWAVPLRDGGRAVLRWYRRGGLLRWVTRDRYLGRSGRPLRELAVTEEARRRGVPAPEVLAVRVDRAGCGTYRAALLTREIPDVVTLAAFLGGAPAPSLRAAVLDGVGRTLRQLHDRGIAHRDLNAANLLVRAGDVPPSVFVVDFDRARAGAPVAEAGRRRALRRLARSLAKLGGAAAGAAEAVAAAYAEGAR
jgi:3-deoxy-D-manno-octulosonic acid kinase